MSVPTRRGLLLLAALAGGVVLAVPMITAAGSGGSILWMVVSGSAACACGLVVGTSARVVPAMVLALVAAAALVLAVEGRQDEPVRSFDSVEAPVRE